MLVGQPGGGTRDPCDHVDRRITEAVDRDLGLEPRPGGHGDTQPLAHQKDRHTRAGIAGLVRGGRVEFVAAPGLPLRDPIGRAFADGVAHDDDRARPLGDQRLGPLGHPLPGVEDVADQGVQVRHGIGWKQPGHDRLAHNVRRRDLVGGRGADVHQGAVDRGLDGLHDDCVAPERQRRSVDLDHAVIRDARAPDRPELEVGAVVPGGLEPGFTSPVRDPGRRAQLVERARLAAAHAVPCKHVDVTPDVRFADLGKSGESVLAAPESGHADEDGQPQEAAGACHPTRTGDRPHPAPPPNT